VEASRTRRTQASVDEVLERLQTAIAAHDRAVVPVRDTFTVIRRWIEDRTLALDRGEHGVHLVDVEAARYGTFDHVWLAGLLEGEWPEPTTRDIFYPSFMLERLGWPDERARAAALRARFADLLTLPARTCGVSVPELDQDAVVRPSALLDELQIFGSDQLLALAIDDLAVPVTREDALLAAAPVPDAPLFDPVSRHWATWRLDRPPRQGVGHTGPAVGERYSVTAVERYLQCPFQYFASRVLALREDAEDEAGLPARDAGLFVHDVLHACFARWHALGQTAIGPDQHARAREVFAEVAEQSLRTLPPTDRPLERVRLFGSSVATGLIEKVLRTEIESFGDVVRRALEHDVDQVVHLPAADGTRAVHLRGRVDRVDWTRDGGLRVIDYKTGRKPQHALQPGVYVHAVIAQERDRGRTATVAPSGFIALREDVPWIQAVTSPEDADAQARSFVEAVDQIEAGAFPVRPANPFRCQFCEYPGVCRKDYVGDE
ncbi:MAG: PD-(D/E)XK nuclease family protein, partial [Luteitalea sp.]